jgi:3',5'-cyclic AMP phosphodiesterase CpdA
MNKPLLILHLSDLHFGPHGRFLGQDMEVLAKRFHQAVEQARDDLKWREQLSLCIVTGDVAEASKPGEYAQAFTFFKALVAELGLSPERVVFVAGNHDVSWNATKGVVLEQDTHGFDDAERDRRIQEVKFKYFDEFLTRFYGGSREQLGLDALGHGAYLQQFPEDRLAVAILNSCERESHLRQGGYLSKEQAQHLMERWGAGIDPRWFKIVAVHHNPVATVSENVQEWLDQFRGAPGKVSSEWLQHFATDCIGFEGREHLKAVAQDCQVQLVLHGHHHAEGRHVWPWQKGPSGSTVVLSAGSWGLQPDKLPGDQPNMMHLVRVDLDKKKVQSVYRVYEARARAKGHVEPGNFTVDPANTQGATLDLTLPRGFLKGTEPSKEGKTAKAQKLAQAYRIRLQRSYERWDAGGLGTVPSGGAGRPIDARLDDMYLPLRIAEGFDVTRLDAGRILEPAELLTRDKPLVIRGAAGSGKTTWMRWTFRRLVESPDALPFMVELRRLARVWGDDKVRGRERTLDAYLATQIAEAGVEDWTATLAAVLDAKAGPRPVLLVDGWDELGPLGEELREKLLSFLVAHPRTLAVVSSRPYGASGPSRGEGFEVLDLQPLSDGEVELFAEGFHRRVLGEDAGTAQASTRRFQETLAASPGARSLARTPLLLSMMLRLGRGRPLPEKRHQLYGECLRSLLAVRPNQREQQGAQLEPDLWRPVHGEERLDAVASLAFQMQTAQRGWELRPAPIVRTREELLPMLPAEWTREQKIGFLEWLVGAAGVMVDRTDGSLSFAHLSFQEYLAAYHLAKTAEENKENFKYTREQAQHQEWWETLRLWAALLDEKNPSLTLAWLLGLMMSGPAGYWLAGAILADGPGSRALRLWMSRTFPPLPNAEWPWILMCATAWASSRQHESRRLIAERWSQVLPQLNWLEAALADEWLKAVQVNVAVPHCNALERLIQEASTGQGVAKARVLFGSHPLWPAEPLELGLLRLIPNRRIIIASRLQGFLSLGADLEQLRRMAPRLFAQQKTSRERLLSSTEELRRMLPALLEPSLARDWTRDWVRYLERHWALEWGRPLETMALDWALDYATGWMGHQDEYLTLTRSRDWVRDWVDGWQLSWARISAEMAASDWAREVSAKPGALAWLPDYAAVEINAGAQAWTRTWVAHSRGAVEPHHRLLQAACRVSLNPQVDRTPLQAAMAAYPKDGEPLWPALARYLARCATQKDRALLIDLIRHPEKREPPLSWGLRYYARGDLVLSDGSELTLDALCQQLGLRPLPYLEEMRPEFDQDTAPPEKRKRAKGPKR